MEQVDDPLLEERVFGADNALQERVAEERKRVDMSFEMGSQSGKDFDLFGRVARNRERGCQRLQRIHGRASRHSNNFLFRHGTLIYSGAGGGFILQEDGLSGVRIQSSDEVRERRPLEAASSGLAAGSTMKAPNKRSRLPMYTRPNTTGSVESGAHRS